MPTRTRESLPRPAPRERDALHRPPEPRGPRGEPQGAPLRAPGLPRRLAAELIGAFFLTLIVAGGAMVGSIVPGELTPAARAAAAGLVVMALVYTIGPVSGAHLNPAVTLAFAVRGVFPWRLLPAYAGAALAGALLAALTLRALLGNVANLGTPSVPAGAGTALAFEIVMTTLLISVVLGTATHHAVVGVNAALAVSGTVVVIGLIAGPISYATLNPALALGPALISGTLADVWIRIVGPAAGALVAAGLAWALHGRRRAEERQVAAGEDGVRG